MNKIIFTLMLIGIGFGVGIVTWIVADGNETEVEETEVEEIGITVDCNYLIDSLKSEEPIEDYLWAFECLQMNHKELRSINSDLDIMHFKIIKDDRCYGKCED